MSLITVITSFKCEVQRGLYILLISLVGVGYSLVLSVNAMTDEVKVTTRSTARVKSDIAETTQPSLHSIDTKLNSILTLLEQNTNDIREIKKEQKDMCESIELCHSNIKDFKQLITDQDKRIIKCENDIRHTNEETAKISRLVKKVEDDVRDLEQYSHRNNLIVYGIPEDKNENILNTVRRLASALQFEEWSSSLIDAVHRMGKSSESRPRPIIIRFVSRLDKDLFLSKRKVRRNLKATDLGFSSENSIYVNESLTPANRELLKKTREAARTRGYSQVWTTNCSIFTRRDKESPAIKIMSEKDLDRM